MDAPDRQDRQNALIGGNPSAILTNYQASSRYRRVATGPDKRSTWAGTVITNFRKFR